MEKNESERARERFKVWNLKDFKVERSMIERCKNERERGNGVRVAERGGKIRKEKIANA